MKFQGVLVILFGVVFFLGCAEEVVNRPMEEKVTYAIADYFPLQIGDEWTWQVHSRDSIPEPYRDGDSCVGEPFTDVDSDGIFNAGVDIFIVCGTPENPCPGNQDLNYNGGYDGPSMCDRTSAAGAFADFNGNGVYDRSNGEYDSGEPYLDFNNDDIRDYTNDYDLRMAVSYSENSYYDGTPYMMLSDSAVVERFWNYGIYYRNGFSVDSLGLRWHYHHGFTSYGSMPYEPIQIAAESLQIGDSRTYMCVDYWTRDTSTWVSTLVRVEDVTVPAGVFTGCLEFRFIASGWVENMEGLNGRSYWWLAKDVGLVKVQGPEGDSWVLEEYNLK